MQICKW